MANIIIKPLMPSMAQTIIIQNKSQQEAGTMNGLILKVNPTQPPIIRPLIDVKNVSIKISTPEEGGWIVITSSEQPVPKIIPYGGAVGPQGPPGPRGPEGGPPGVGLEFTWSYPRKTRLGVKREDEEEYDYSDDLTGPQGPEGPMGPEGPEGPKGDRGPGLLFQWYDNTWLGVKVEGSEQDYDYRNLQGPVGPMGPRGLQGPQGPQGEQGVGLQFLWDSTRLGVKREDENEYQ